MNITISENLRKLRKQRNVTQEALADHLAVTPQAVSRWKSGAGYPAIEYLPDLAGFFSVSVDELLGVRLSERQNSPEIRKSGLPWPERWPRPARKNSRTRPACRKRKRSFGI